MKLVIELSKLGFQKLSHRGKLVLISYSASLSLIVILDVVALFLLSTSILSLQTASTYPQGSEQIKLVIVVVLFILRSGLSMAISYLGLHELAKDEVEIGQSNFEYFMKKPWIEARDSPASDLYMKVDRAPNAMIQNFLILVATVIAESFGAVLIIAALAVIQPLTAATAGTYFLVVALVQHRWLSNASSKAGQEIATQHNHVYDLLNDAFGLSRVMRVMPSTSIVGELTSRRQRLAFARAQAMFLNMVPRYFMEAVLAFGFIVIAGVSSYINGINSVFPAITIFAAAGFRLLPIINRIQGLVLGLYIALPLAQESVPVPLPLNAESASSIANQIPKANTDIKPNIAISLRELSFKFPDGNHNVINRISLDFEKGKTYALVGPSGSGKSTLVDLCLRLLIPTEGEVVWSDDKCVIGYVPQEAYMSSQDFYSNVSIEWNDNAVDELKVVKAAEQAQLSEFLNSGVIASSNRRNDLRSLSGGQKQRVALARALYRNPKVLVLDEPTSALDAELESEIMEAVWNIAGEVTVIIVAHRLTTIQDCDEIVYIKDGEMAAKGNFSELMRILPDFSKQVELGTFSL